MLSEYKLKQTEELVSIIYTSSNPPNRVAACAETVCNMAAQNEPNAVAIVDAAAEALVRLARQAAEILPDSKTYPVALAGSVLGESSVVTRLFQTMMAAAGLQVDYYRESIPPAAAALLFAIRREYLQPGAALVAQLQSLRFAEHV